MGYVIKDTDGMVLGYVDKIPEGYEEYDEDYCDGDCESCPECDDEVEDSLDAEYDLINEYANKVIDGCCPAYIFETLLEMAETFKQIGYDDCKAEMQDMLDLMD